MGNAVSFQRVGRGDQLTPPLLRSYGRAEPRTNWATGALAQRLIQVFRGNSTPSVPDASIRGGLDDAFRSLVFHMANLLNAVNSGALGSGDAHESTACINRVGFRGVDNAIRSLNSLVTKLGNEGNPQKADALNDALNRLKGKRGGVRRQLVWILK